jgi:hypothetical protein
VPPENFVYPEKSIEEQAPAKSVNKPNTRPSPPTFPDPIPENSSDEVSTTSRLPEQEVDFAELEDGTLVEMIEDPANPTRSLLAVYKNGIVECVEKFRDGDRVLVPLARTDLILRHIRLPQGAEHYGKLLDLLGDIGAILSPCLDIAEDSLFLMIAFVLSTWFPEKLTFAPYLALVGPPSSGKTTALRILALLCRRSLSTTDISSAAFYQVCHRMSPTVVIDETRTAGNTRTLLHLLKSSNVRGFVALRKDKAQLAYGPKLLSWVELPKDPQLNSRCIIVPMQRTGRADLLSPDDPQVIQCAAKVRRRLVQFRLEHFNNLVLQEPPADLRLSSRSLDVYRALALPVGENQAFCERLAHLVAAQRQFLPALLSPQSAAAVRVLYLLIHIFPESPCFPLSMVTSKMNKDLADSGEPSGLNERKVGDILTSLSLTNRTRQNTGYVLCLNRSDRVQIHELPRKYEIDRIPMEPILSCNICNKPSETSSSSVAKRDPIQNNTGVEKPMRERREHGERHLMETKRRTGPSAR